MRPEAAVVLCVDEKTQIQALDRTSQILPLMPGVPQRRTHDYKRNGVTNLYAALDVASGHVITDMTSRHRAVEFKKFLNLIDRTVPEDLDVHIVLDNVSTLKTPEIQRWLQRHRRFTFHFTPTYSSWMNLVERWFAELTNKSLRRSTHHSTRDLAASIRTWTDNWNENPQPFVRHKTADQILDTLAVAASHQVGDLAFDFGTGRPVVGSPVGIVLLLSGIGETLLVTPDTGSATSLGGGALRTQRTAVTGVGERGSSITVGAPSDGDSHTVGTGDSASVEIDDEAVFGEQATSPDYSRGCRDEAVSGFGCGSGRLGR